MAKLNGRVLPESVQMTCVDDANLGSYSMVLSKDHRKSTIALSFIYFSNMFVEFGLIVLLPLVFSSHFCGAAQPPKYDCQLLSSNDLRELSVATAGSMCGCVAALVCAQGIGRLLPLRVTSFIMALSIGCLFPCVNDSFTFAVTIVSKTTEAFVNTLICIMIPESFPTSIRSTAAGFINGWGKIGGVIGTGCVDWLFYVNPYAVIGLFFFVSFIGFVGTMVYDRETKYEVLKDT